MIIERETEAVLANIQERTETVYRTHNAAGRLRSGATIVAIIESMKATADAFVDDVGGKVRAVISDQEAFAALSRATADCLEICSAHIPRLLRNAVMDEESPAGVAARKRWEAARLEVQRKLAILEYDFGSPLAAPDRSAVPAHRGGRPRAAFWKDMWAKIAADLFTGDLKPVTQADVERAMADWISANGHTAAESVIRDRARLLWRLIR